MLEPEHDRWIFESLQHMVGTQLMQDRRWVRHRCNLLCLLQPRRYVVHDAASRVLRNDHLASVGHSGREFGEIMLCAIGKRRTLQMMPMLVRAFDQPHN